MSEERLRPVLAKFSQLMELRLKENDYKGGWDKDTLEYLLSGLEGELKELSNNIRGYIYCPKANVYEYCPPDTEEDNIISEAADVANFAMMIADRAHAMYKKT